MKAILRKVAFNKGKTDNGIEYDYTRLFIERPISADSQNEFGHDLIQCEFGSAEKVKEIQHLRGRLPVEVEVDLVPEIKGKKVIQVVHSLRVLDKEPSPASSAKA